MASSSNKQNIQTTLNVNYQKELGKLFTENKELQRQVREAKQKKLKFCFQMRLRFSKIIIYQKRNKQQTLIFRNEQAIRQGRRITEQDCSIHAIKSLKHQSNGEPMDIETEQILVYKQRRIPRCWFCKRREEGIQSDNEDNSLKNKRQKKQNYEIKQSNYTAYNKDKYIKENSTKHGNCIKPKQKQTILE